MHCFRSFHSDNRSVCNSLPRKQPVVAKKASGGKFGGRDVRKVVRKDIEDKVANIIVEADGNISQIDVDADGDEIKVTGK